MNSAGYPPIKVQLEHDLTRLSTEASQRVLQGHISSIWRFRVHMIQTMLLLCCFTTYFRISLFFGQTLRPISGAQFLEKSRALVGNQKNNCWIVSGGNFHLFLLGFDISLKPFEPPPPCFTHGGCCLNQFSHLSPTCAKETNAQGQSGNSFWREEKGLFQICRPLK